MQDTNHLDTLKEYRILIKYMKKDVVGLAVTTIHKYKENLLVTSLTYIKSIISLIMRRYNL